MSHAFPLVRAGGLFIGIMGIGVILGGMFAGRRMLLLTLGGIAATTFTILFANELTRPLGLPTTMQVRALVGAVLVEALLIGVVVGRFKRAGERPLMLAILVAVGIHFLPMAIAFGPLCAALGAAVVTNGSLGLWVMRRVSLNFFWIIDGLLKISFGGAMLLLA